MTPELKERSAAALAEMHMEEHYEDISVSPLTRLRWKLTIYGSRIRDAWAVLRGANRNNWIKR